MFWFFDQDVCGILASQPGIELAPPAWEGEVLTTELPGKFPYEAFFNQACLLALFFPQQLIHNHFLRSL